MTDFWPGQDPWNALERNPAWDGAAPARGQEDIRPPETEALPAQSEPSYEVAFVQQAIQRVYHP